MDYECCSNDDCDDGNESTRDVCDNPSTVISECLHEAIEVTTKDNTTLNETMVESSVNVTTDNSTMINETDTNITQVNTTDTNTTNETMSNYCETDADCIDSNLATKDVCKVEQNQCSHTLIKDCVHNDSYCPTGCAYATDNDCENFEDGRCREDADCDDNLTSTSNYCIVELGECEFSPITSCTNDDQYCPINCDNSTDNDCSSYNVCSMNEDCDDNNDTTTDSCLADDNEVKICINLLEVSCTNDDDFCPYLCNNATDNDCVNITANNSDSYWTDCSQDAFCYMDKVVNNDIDCTQMTRFFADPFSHLVNTCYFNEALADSSSSKCDDITDADVKRRCTDNFS
jgi:hypothetical protein